MTADQTAALPPLARLLMVAEWLAVAAAYQDRPGAMDEHETNAAVLREVHAALRPVVALETAEDARLLAVAEARAARDSGRRHDLDDVLAATELHALLGVWGADRRAAEERRDEVRRAWPEVGQRLDDLLETRDAAPAPTVLVAAVRALAGGEPVVEVAADYGVPVEVVAELPPLVGRAASGATATTLSDDAVGRAHEVITSCWRPKACGHDLEYDCVRAALVAAGGAVPADDTPPPAVDSPAADELLLVRLDGRKSGRVTIGHSRLPVDTIVGELVAGTDHERITASWPGATPEVLRVLDRLVDDLGLRRAPIRCPHCLDYFGLDDVTDGDVHVVCAMCAKAGRPAATGADPNDLEMWICRCGQRNPGIQASCIQCDTGRAAGAVVPAPDPTTTEDRHA